MRRAADVGGPELPDEGVCDQDFGRWLLGQVHLLRGRERQVVLARAHGISTLEFARMHQISVKAAEGAFTRGGLGCGCSAPGPSTAPRHNGFPPSSASGAGRVGTKTAPEFRECG